MSIADVREQFGEDVANLIGGHTEDKSKSWEVRKQSMIDAVAEGDMRLKMLVMADILSNMRNSWSDYQKEGDTFWGKFNAPKIKQSWYYSTMLDAVYDLQFEENAADFYWEATAVYKDIFVRYYLDEEKQQIYQIAEHGEGSVRHWAIRSGAQSKIKCRNSCCRYPEKKQSNWKMKAVSRSGRSMSKR